MSDEPNNIIPPGETVACKPTPWLRLMLASSDGGAMKAPETTVADTLSQREAVVVSMDWPFTDPVIEKYKRFMPVVHAIAQMSKYPGTRVGALVLGDRFEPLSSGWNGAARGSRADEDGRLADRETRLLWACHAESNAVANAAATGTSLLGGTLLCTLMPCMACAKMVVQAGIKRVIVPRPDQSVPEVARWTHEFNTTRDLFNECGVQLVEFDEKSA